MSEQSKSKSPPKSSVSKSTETAPKSDTVKASDSTTSDSTSSDSTSSDSNSSTTSKSEGGKSSRESIGGASAVHYGFFSNVKTPKYRSGWDDIWSKETKPKKKQPAQAKQPIVISLALDELPDELRKSLADVARAQLKISRINYDKCDKAGAVTWRIDCEVKP